MAKPMSMTILLVIVLTAVAAVIQVTEAASYVVGDSVGWVVPRANPTLYTTWTSGKRFSVGDVLVFNFMTNVHDVATVSKADYDACAIDNTRSLVTTGPYNYTIDSTGTHYIICTIANGGHCKGGQKLTISVGDSSGTSPASSPTGGSPTSSPTAGSPTSPPTAAAGSPTSPSGSPTSTETAAGSSASSLAATLPLVFIAIALAFFY